MGNVPRHRRCELPGEVVAFENPHLPPPKYPRFTWWTAVYERYSDNHLKYRPLGSPSLGLGKGFHVVYPGR